jgi:hypothetical protein
VKNLSGQQADDDSSEFLIVAGLEVSDVADREHLVGCSSTGVP